jgi:hypothetical protein
MTGKNEQVMSDDTSLTAAHCLRLPGKQLNLTALLYAKKFRQFGYKKGALAAFKKQEESGLGVLNTSSGKSGTVRLSVILL